MPSLKCLADRGRPFGTRVFVLVAHFSLTKALYVLSVNSLPAFSGGTLECSYRSEWPTMLGTCSVFVLAEGSSRAVRAPEHQVCYSMQW